MKRTIIFLAMMMVSFPVFALDTISDLELNDLTGQAGVSIFLNTIRIEKAHWVSGYGDEGEAAFGNNTNWLLMSAEGRTQEISFLGSRTLDIDIVSRTEFTNAILSGAVPGVHPADASRFGGLQMSALDESHSTVSDSVSDTALIISLPNGIQIADCGDVVTIGLGQVANTAAIDFDTQMQVLIKTYSGGGTTTISGAGGPVSANNAHIGIMAHD